METKIVLTDTKHPDKRAEITLLESGQINLEFFPVCGEDDKTPRSYAQLARKILSLIIDKNI